MKKIISLILALVLCTGILAGVSFAAEKPTECTEQQAAVVVTHAGDTTAKYYFDTLSQDVINWACQGLEGVTTITLIKDIELDASTATNRFTIPYALANWFGSKPDAKSLVIDLGGNTLRHHGDSYLFKMTRYGMTVKNGTIDQEGSRAVFTFGTSTSSTGTSAGNLFKPVLNLENVHVYNAGTGANSLVVLNYIHGTTVNVKDSVLWAAKKSAITMSKTDQSEKARNYKAYAGSAQLAVNVENSTVISSGSYPIDIGDRVDLAADNATVTIQNSILVSGKDSAIEAAKASAFDTKGVQPTEQAGWSLFLNNGKTATGTASTYGAGSSAGKLPFTDVAESAWYYSYVRDLYNAKVIAGMTETTFVPEGTLTYGQALKLITLAVGEKEQAATDSHWASGYLNLALEKTWMYNEVDLNSTITREVFCQIAATAAGIVEQPAANPFKDTNDSSVLALYNAGIINGMTADTFSPNSSLTRAQISKIIHGILSK